MLAVANDTANSTIVVLLSTDAGQSFHTVLSRPAAGNPQIAFDRRAGSAQAFAIFNATVRRSLDGETWTDA